MIPKRRPLIEMDTKLENIPREWLEFVEPRLQRPKDSTCWLWPGAKDREGEPVIHVTVEGKRKTIRVKRLIAKIFWEMKQHFDVIHECGVINCLNPSHFYITAAHWSQEDRMGIVKQKQRSLRDYLNRK